MGLKAMSKLRFGILSTADIARKKVIPGMRRANRVDVAAVASRDLAQAQTTAMELGIPRAYGSYQALLADADVDAVYIPLPNNLHLEWTVAAARAGKHVLCEKPLTLTSADAQVMVDECRAHGVQLMEAFMYRQHPTWRAVVDLVESGRIGDLTAVESWFSYYNDDPGNIRNIAEAGGGALYDIGCYSINLSRMLFAGEPSRVQSALRRDKVMGVDVLASAILEFERGIATFTVSTRVETDQRVHIYGTDGRISIGIPFNIPPDRPTQIFLTAGGDPPVNPKTEVMTFATADPYAAEADAFAASILDGTPLPVSPEDAVANLRVIEQVFSAAERPR